MCAKERSGATVRMRVREINLLGNDMEDIQKLIEKEKGEQTYGKNNP